jgi:hypothetical protein
MKVKTSELTGRNLNWAVAIALGWKWKVDSDGKIILARPAKNIHSRQAFDTLRLANFQSTSSWSIAGPIIERERLSLTPRDGYWDCYVHDRLFEEDGTDHYSTGTTPLIAAMRCFVASRLGEEVDIPEELK